MDGLEKMILVTVGFDDHGPREVFCADFKAGTAMHSIVMDACILLSRLLQHGDSPDDILAGMSGGGDERDHKRSLIGRIAELLVGD